MFPPTKKKKVKETPKQRLERLKRAGSAGGKMTKKRYGSDYFSQLSFKRKSHNGGKPKTKKSK